MRASPSHDAGRQRARSRWNLLLAAPVLLPPAAVALLNRVSPELFGMPFFYWGQAAAVAVSMLSVAVVGYLTRRRW